jgi:hypothetical protein
MFSKRVLFSLKGLRFLLDLELLPGILINKYSCAANFLALLNLLKGKV